MITTADEDVKPAVAYLREIIRPGNREPFLYQSKVSEHRFYEDFAEFAADFVGAAQYPSPQSNKFETYSFAPTIFWEGEYRPRSRPDAEPKFGFYRTGESCVGEIYLGYFDVDNHTDNPVVTIDEIEAVLTALGVSHVLYTSYSHLKKDGRHKVRIITPISREVTYDEMFQVFTVFNHLFHYQLDASIYDPGDHLYGPTYGGDVRIWVEGAAVDVDAVIAEAANLPEEAARWCQRGETRQGARRALTEAEIASLKVQLADHSVATGVGIENTRYVRREWLEDFDRLYKGGSHRQTLMGTMSKIWLRSGGTLSYGEMTSLQTELDFRQGMYCHRNYGAEALRSDIRSVMAMAVTAKSEEDHRSSRLASNLRRFTRRR